MAILIIWAIGTGVVALFALYGFFDSLSEYGDDDDAKIAALVFFFSWAWPLAALVAILVIIWKLFEYAAGGVMLLAGQLFGGN